MIKFSKSVLLVSTFLFVSLKHTHVASAQLAPSTGHSGQSLQKSEVHRYTEIVAEVDKIAEQVTVKVDSSTPGSGVIIGKNGQTYYVLTAKHVVTDLKDISIIAMSGKRYLVRRNAVTKYEDYDLALIEFTCAENYLIATLANYNIDLSDEPVVFLSGFPKDENASSLTRTLTMGTTYNVDAAVFKVYESFSFLEGNELLYTNLTKYGMSGGPVFDHLGRVIGIHTRKENLLGRGIGVPIKFFLGIVSKNVKNQLQIASNVPPILARTVLDAIQNDFLPEYFPTKSSNSEEWIDYGTKLWQVGKYPDAVSAFDHAIKLDKNSARAYYAKGLALEAQGKDQEAAVVLNKAIQKRALYPEAWTLLSRLYNKLMQYDDALKAINEAAIIKQHDPDPQIFCLRGVILSNLNRDSEANEAFSKSISIRENAISYLSRSLSRKKLNDQEGASFDYKQALLLLPNIKYSYTEGDTTIMNFCSP
jgi:S1-C subfamily serine protease